MYSALECLLAAEVFRIWEIYDHHLQFVEFDDLDAFGDALAMSDVSAAWLTCRNCIGWRLH